MRLSKDVAQKRKLFIIEQYIKNPDISNEQVQNLLKDNFGRGASASTLLALKKEATTLKNSKPNVDAATITANYTELQNSKKKPVDTISLEQFDSFLQEPQLYIEERHNKTVVMDDNGIIMES